MSSNTSHLWQHQIPLLFPGNMFQGPSLLVNLPQAPSRMPHRQPMTVLALTHIAVEGVSSEMEACRGPSWSTRRLRGKEPRPVRAHRNAAWRRTVAASSRRA